MAPGDVVGAEAGFGEALDQVDAVRAEGLFVCLGILDLALNQSRQLAGHRLGGFEQGELLDRVDGLEDGCRDGGQDRVELMLGVDLLAVLLGLERQAKEGGYEVGWCKVGHVADEVDHSVASEVVALFPEQLLRHILVEGLDLLQQVGSNKLPVDLFATSIMKSCIPGKLQLPLASKCRKTAMPSRFVAVLVVKCLLAGSREFHLSIPSQPSRAAKVKEMVALEILQNLLRL